MHSRVGLEQARLGLNDPVRLRSLSYIQNIKLKAQAMRNAGVSEHLIQTLKKEALAHGSSLAK